MAARVFENPRRWYLIFAYGLVLIAMWAAVLGGGSGADERLGMTCFTVAILYAALNTVVERVLVSETELCVVRLIGTRRVKRSDIEMLYIPKPGEHARVVVRGRRLDIGLTFGMGEELRALARELGLEIRDGR